MGTLIQYRRILGVAVLSLLAGVVLLTAVPAFAQSAPGVRPLGVYLRLVFLVLFIPFYIYWAAATQIIARKTNTADPWLAWIPIANLVLWAHIAKKPIWWGLLCIVPLVGMVFMALVWMGIAEARHKANWWGILSIVPVVHLIVPAYLALSN